jgi:hypothetical protein
MLLGAGLWYGFFGSTATDETKFNGKLDEMCREVEGAQPKKKMSLKTVAKTISALSPKPARASAPAPAPAKEPKPTVASVKASSELEDKLDSLFSE